MSEDAPAPVAVEPPLRDPCKADSLPPCPVRGWKWDEKLKAWRPKRKPGRKRIHTGQVSTPILGRNVPPPPGMEDWDERTLVIATHARPLNVFDVEDWRERLQLMSREVTEMALVEIRDRLAHPSKVARIPTTTLMKVVKYLDERNLEIAKAMQEEGLSKNSGPVEQHTHFTQNIISLEEVAELTEATREKVMLRLLASARGEKPDEVDSAVAPEVRAG